jgi:hypothetical protein
VIPEEDLPPSWLRDYGDIEADISRMEEFAKKLNNEVTNNYAPHLPYVFDDMLTELPSVYTDFPELHAFRETYRVTAQLTTNTVYNYRDATEGFATAAKTVSNQYQSSDAFSKARVTDVEAALNETAASAPAAPATQPSAAPNVGEGPTPSSEGIM